MRSVVVRRFGGPEVLELVESDVPDPLPYQIRVHVSASTVNPIDVSTRAGRLTEAGLVAPAQQLGLGWDVAGTVSATGDAVERFAVGDHHRRPARPVVRPRGPRRRSRPRCLRRSTGALLDRPAPRGDAAAQRPDRRPALELTGLQRGQTLLVTGAAGAVGGFALELAALRGLRTVAVARVEDEPLVRALGAAEFVPRTDRLGTAVRALVPGGVDAVIDCAVLGIAAHGALRGEGTFVALVAPFAPPPIRGTRVLVQEVWADGARLTELVALVVAQHLTLRVARVLPLTEAAEAHRLVEAGGLRGRVVLEP
jgi:NADPH:quinone reductase-like Zn-dependent oxidoreductase